MSASSDSRGAEGGPALANLAKDRMRRGAVALGMIVRLARSAEIVAIAEATGHDFLVVDTQHALFPLERIGDIAQAALRSGITVLVRVRGCDDPDISRLLDAGIGGIVVPDIGTRAQAERAVAAARFAPVGRRSVPGPFASLGYRRLPAHEASWRLDDATLLVCMVETREGVENAAEIASVPGVDLVHVGCVDLSHDLGPESPVGHPSVTAAALRVIGAACGAGKLAGVGGDWDPDRQAAYVQAGARYLTTQTDTGLLLEAAGRATATLRNAVAGRTSLPGGAGDA